MFEQVGVLQQAQQEVALLFEGDFHQRQISTARVDRRFVAPQHRLHLCEVRLGPSTVDPQVFAHVFGAGIESREQPQQRGANLTKEDADRNVQFSPNGLAFMRVEELIENQGGQHRLHEQEGDVHEQIEENVVGVAKDGPVERIGRCRRQE